MILRTSSSGAYRAGIDHYLRVSERELQELNLGLLWTEWPSVEGGELHGYTEWSGWHRGVTVSVACFWRFDQGAQVMALCPCDVSTNLMLVDAKGYDAGPGLTAKSLMPLIHQRLLNDVDASADRSLLPGGFGGLLQ